MTTTTPRRRALVDLPVNTIAALSITNKMNKAATGLKRPHSAIDQQENDVSQLWLQPLTDEKRQAGSDAARKVCPEWCFSTKHDFAESSSLRPPLHPKILHHILLSQTRRRRKN